MGHDEEDKKEGYKKYNKKKHWTHNILIEVPNQPEPLKLEVDNTLKVKRLRELIFDKIGGDIKPDRFKLQIEGGEVLQKSQKQLGDFDINEGKVI